MRNTKLSVVILSIYSFVGYDLSLINTTLDFVHFDCSAAEEIAQQLKETKSFEEFADIVDKVFSHPTKLLYANVFMKEWNLKWISLLIEILCIIVIH